MRTLFYPALLFCVAAVMSRCSTTMYTSNAVNAPLLAERGEFKATVTQNDLQLAAGLGGNFGLMANGFFKSYKDDNDYQHRGSLAELGLGYYTTTGNKMAFETFIGAGYGSVYKQQRFTEQGENVLGRFNADAFKVFLQPDFGYRSKVFDAIFTPRLSFVKYTSFSHTNYSAEALENDYLDNNRLTGPMFMFAEPTLTLRAGFKFFKLQAQYGLTLNMTGNNIRHPDNFSSLGIVIDVAKWYDEDGK